MHNPSSCYWLPIRLFFIVLVVTTAAVAQSVQVQPRIVESLDETRLTTLRGNTHPLALAKFDQGAAPPTLPMDRMLLVLKRSPEQEADLRQLLDAQQDKSSPVYHKWLKPEEFGKRFGPADADIQNVTAWLASHGFQSAKVSKGRTVIEFSGTAATVKDAFHTDIHKYLVNAEEHWANASDPQIPSALTPVVGGVWTMHNFLMKPMSVISSERFPLLDIPGSNKPLATSSSGHHFLSPGDFSLIYDINLVYGAGIQGNGVTIAVVARSDINPGDVGMFYSIFGFTFLGVNTTWNGPDPGDLGGGEEAEAVLDATWAGALAPGARIVQVVSASTDTTDGVDLSALYIVDNNVGDVMTESFGICEPAVTSAQLAGFSALAEQAAAQGITYVVSSGDTGSAGCDHLSETTATKPPAVSALASTPFNVAVGGTIFNENGHDSTYWSSSTTVPVTALKYIPESVWNESCTSCAHPGIAAGGGGPSAFVPKPSWQSGVRNIPSDGFRDVPDLSLTAAIHDPYLICLAGSCGGAQAFLVGIAGTSASAPSFAGIMALVDQRVGGRVGAANYVLYKLAAAETLSQCNASSTTTAPATTCVFNDVTVGNNAVPGESSYGTSNPQFASGVGYDLATGLGSLRVTNLVNNWSTVSFKGSATTLALNPQTNILHGSGVAVTIQVAPAPPGGTATPTGDVALMVNSSSTGTLGQSADRFTLGAGGNLSTNTHALPGGTNLITANYAGDATFAPSISPQVQVTVNPEPSTTTVTALTADATGHPIPFTSGTYGQFVYLRVDVKGNSGYGTPVGQVTFSDNTGFTTASNLNSQGNTAPAPNGIFNLAAGSHTLSATYGGDLSFQPSAPSVPVMFTIAKASTATTVQSDATAVASGGGVSFTATVSAAGQGNQPSGNVVFSDGGTVLGTGVIQITGIPPSGSTVQSQAFYGPTVLANGQHNITAQYAADSNYVGSTSTAISVKVAPDFTVQFDAASISVAGPGLSGSINLTITGQTGYNETVNLSSTSCSGLPLGATCSFNPASITGSGTNKLTISTLAPHVVLAGHPTSQRQLPIAGGIVGMGFVLGGFFVLGAVPRRTRFTAAMGLLVLAVLLAGLGCGGGSSSGGGGSPGTPVGSSTVTVTTSSPTFTHKATFTLMVQ